MQIPDLHAEGEARGFLAGEFHETAGLKADELLGGRGLPLGERQVANARVVLQRSHGHIHCHFGERKGMLATWRVGDGPAFQMTVPFDVRQWPAECQSRTRCAIQMPREMEAFAERSQRQSIELSVPLA